MTESTLSAVRRSLVVDAPATHTFDAFVEMSAWWPLATHTIGDGPARASIVESHAGGRWYEIDGDGTERDIGRVRAFERPTRIVLTWQLNCDAEGADFRFDPTIDTEVEVRFTAESATRTRVDLEHRGFDTYGALAEANRERYESENAWTAVLACFERRMAASVTP